MAIYLTKRLAALAIVVFGVTTVVFFAVRLSGDPATLMVSQGASAADIERLRRNLGLDDPLYVQYGRFVTNVFHGDLGMSLRSGQPVLGRIARALPITLVLTLAALIVALSIAVPAGIIAALRRGSVADSAAMSISVIGQAIPGFWLGIMLILAFSVTLGWLPSGGWGRPEQIVLPAVTLGAYSMARISRLVRSGMLDVMSQDYMRTARSKGLAPFRIVMRHAFKNAAIPVVTVTGLEFGVLLGGAVLTETIFSIPGMGRLAVDSVANRDYPVVQGVVLVAAVLVSLTNLIVDVVYTYLDPRIRLQ